MADTVIPDFLAGLLDEEFEEVFASDAAVERVRLPRMTVPQFKPGSQDHSVLGKVVLVPLDKEAEPTVVPTVRLMLIDELTFSLRKPLSGGVVTSRHFPQDILASDYAPFVTVGKEGVGARTFWKVDANGKRDMSANAPACGSENGIVPWTRYIGTEALDPRRGEVVRIGTMYTRDDDGVVVGSQPSKFPCLTCQLARWYKTSDGKNLPPVCSHTPKWVVYNVDDGQLYELRGQNRGLLLALSGNPDPKKPTDPAYWNGDPMMGLTHYFASAAENPRVKKALTGMLEGAEPLPTASISRPYGMPTLANLDAPVYPVMMYITLSNFSTSATLVPAFVPTMGGEVLAYGNVKTNAKTVADSVRLKLNVPNAPLTQDELAGWLAARKQYHEEHYREQLMNREEIPEAVGVSLVTPEMLAAPGGEKTLPSGVPWTDGDIVEE